MKKSISKTIKEFKDRYQGHGRPHVSPESVRTAREVIRLVVWLMQHNPWN